MAAPTTPGNPLLARLHGAAVFVGVALALVGTMLFARGWSVDAQALRADLLGGDLGSLVTGLGMLAIGVVLATAPRFGRQAAHAALGGVLLVLGIAWTAHALLTPADALQLAAEDAAADGTFGSLALALALLTTMTGALLLFVFGRRARVPAPARWGR